MGSDYRQITAIVCNGLARVQAREYFRRSVLAKSFEQSSEQSEDNSVDISRKDLDGD